MEKASPFTSEIGDAFRKGSENDPTLRFTLSLPASDDKTCPEYSFLDLVKSASRKVGESLSRFSVQCFSLKRRKFRLRRTLVCIFFTAVRMAVILINFFSLTPADRWNSRENSMGQWRWRWWKAQSLGKEIWAEIRKLYTPMQSQYVFLFEA